mgnify:FL=1
MNIPIKLLELSFDQKQSRNSSPSPSIANKKQKKVSNDKTRLNPQMQIQKLIQVQMGKRANKSQTKDFSRRMKLRTNSKRTNLLLDKTLKAPVSKHFTRHFSLTGDKESQEKKYKGIHSTATRPGSAQKPKIGKRKFWGPPESPKFCFFPATTKPILFQKTQRVCSGNQTEETHALVLPRPSFDNTVI